MTDVAGPRAAEYASRFEAAQREFIDLVESLTDEQWARPGRNHPERLNDEDEARTVGVIAHHVGVSAPFIMGRIRAMLEGGSLSAVDINAINAQHAIEHSGVSREDVVKLMRRTGTEIAEAVRRIPDDQLDVARDTPVGPMSVGQRLERVLIGHIKSHDAVIRASLS